MTPPKDSTASTFEHLFGTSKTYAQISQPDLDNNLAEYNTNINPGLPLKVYTRKQEKCQIFASDAGIPISDTTLVTTGCKHALASSNMTLGWRE